MEKFQLDNNMVESIEFMIELREYHSVYGIMDMLASDDDNGFEFYTHSQKINSYFNDFEETEDDNNFMKCLMGYYEVKSSPEENILEYYQQMLSDKNSEDFDRKFIGEQGVEAIVFVLTELDRLDIISKPEGE